jgi:hypothetical protein
VPLLLGGELVVWVVYNCRSRLKSFQMIRQLVSRMAT